MVRGEQLGIDKVDMPSVELRGAIAKLGSDISPSHPLVRFRLILCTPSSESLDGDRKSGILPVETIWETSGGTAESSRLNDECEYHDAVMIPGRRNTPQKSDQRGHPVGQVASQTEV